MRQWMIVIAAALILGGCGGVSEPKGRSVELTQADQDRVKWAHDEKELWAAWHTKGTRFVNEEKYEEALYCFNQALAAWPKEFDDGKTQHQAEPGDTLVAKANLFLRMNEPELAIKYYEKFDTYRPFNKVSKEGIEKAKMLMEK